MKTRTTLTLDKPVFTKLQAHAARERRSISQQISLLIERDLKIGHEERRTDRQEVHLEAEA